MMCDCREKMKQTILSQFPTATDFVFKDYMNTINRETMKISHKPVMVMTFDYTVKGKKKERQVSERAIFKHEFCPFCGVMLEEDKKDGD